MGLLRSLGCEDLKREGSVAKALLKRHSLEEIEIAVHGLRAIFPKGPVSLRMIHGRSRIGSYVGWVSAFNAGVKLGEVRREAPDGGDSRLATASRVSEMTGESRVDGQPESAWRSRTDARRTRSSGGDAGRRTSSVESVGAILGRMR